LSVKSRISIEIIAHRAHPDLARARSYTSPHAKIKYLLRMAAKSFG